MRSFVTWQRFLLRLAMCIPFGRPAAATGISDAVSALNGLMTTYDPSTGLWNYNESSAAWWQSAIALQAVLDFMITTGTRDYIPIANYTINTQRASVAGWPQGGGDFRAASTDDTGWWALAVLSMYSITGEKYLLDIAVADEAYMSQYWTGECNGGLIWQIRDLERSLIAWEWLKGSGMINGASLINDGLMSGLGAMIQLQTATGDAQFINTARHIADAVLSSTQLVPQGILTEPCADGCTSADQHSFKGIFARYLAQLDAKLPDQPYGAFITSNAASMVAHDQVPSQDELANDLYGLNWQGPFDKNSLGSQESAVMLLTAALSVQM